MVKMVVAIVLKHAIQLTPTSLRSLFSAYKFYQKSDSGSSRKLFRFSLIQLPILMVLFFVNKKEWISKKENTNNRIANVSPPLESSIVKPTVDAVL